MRLITRLRMCLRRWLGLEHWEELQLTELRGLMQRVDSLVSRTNNLEDRFPHAWKTDGIVRRMDSVKREMEELGINMTAIMDSLGGLWRTSSGYTVPIRIMSDTHIKSVLDGGFGNMDARDLMRQEVARREEDDRWAKKQGPGSLRDRVSALERGHKDPKPPSSPPVSPDRYRGYKIGVPCNPRELYFTKSEVQLMSECPSWTIAPRSFHERQQAGDF